MSVITALKYNRVASYDPLKKNARINFKKYFIGEFYNITINYAPSTALSASKLHIFSIIVPINEFLIDIYSGVVIVDTDEVLLPLKFVEKCKSVMQAKEKLEILQSDIIKHFSMLF
jgi:hypothetical protein